MYADATFVSEREGNDCMCMMGNSARGVLKLRLRLGSVKVCENDAGQAVPQRELKYGALRDISRIAVHGKES